MSLMWIIVGIIVIAALCNPRLWKDIKNAGTRNGGKSSMQEYLEEGEEDLKAAFRHKHKRDEDEEDE